MVREVLAGSDSGRHLSEDAWLALAHGNVGGDADAVTFGDGSQYGGHLPQAGQVCLGLRRFGDRHHRQHGQQLGRGGEHRVGDGVPHRSGVEFPQAGVG